MEKEKIIIDYCTPKYGDEMDIKLSCSDTGFYLTFTKWAENIYMLDASRSFLSEMDILHQYEGSKFIFSSSLKWIHKFFDYLEKGIEFEDEEYEIVDRRKEKINLEIEVLKNKLEKIKDKTIWSYSDSYNHKLITEFRHIEKRIKELEGEINGKE